MMSTERAVRDPDDVSGDDGDEVTVGLCRVSRILKKPSRMKKRYICRSEEAGRGRGGVVRKTGNDHHLAFRTKK